MRIALFDNHVMLDGAQRALVDLARGLLMRKWEVSAILGGDGPLAVQLSALSIPLEFLALPGWAQQDQAPEWFSAGWLVAFRLAQFLRRQHVEVLYANSPVSALLGGVAARLAGIRLIWRVHLAAEITHARFTASLALHLATQIHVATASAQEALAPSVGHATRICVLPPAIDVERVVACAPPLRKSRELPVVGMVAPWSPTYGQEVLFRAIRHLHEGGRRARLCLVGQARTPEEERFRSVVLSAVRAAGLNERVSVREVVDDLPAFLASCDIIAVPTLRDTTGRLALEAAAVGRPVIASRLDALTAIIEDGHTGLLAPPNQPQALADALALLLASPALRIQMGRQARVRCEEHFTPALTITALENLLRNPEHKTPRWLTPPEWRL